MTKKESSAAGDGLALAGPGGACGFVTLAVGAQQLRHLGGGLRRAEQIALHFRTAERAQPLPLCFGLDAFGRRRHAARRGDVDHRFDDACGAFSLVDIGDEAAVDLDLVERKTL
jgi:hypothetical protein